MFFKLLGMAVWYGGKFFLRRRYGSTYVPKPVLAGVLVAGLAAVGAGVALAARSGDGEE
jgi:hypothetical protein